MSAADDVALIRRAVDAFNRNDTYQFGELYAPDIVRHDLANVIDRIEGVSGVQGYLGLLRTALPDLQIELSDVFANDEGRVATRLTFTGTHLGELLGVAPTGKKVTFTGVNLYRIADGRMAETWQLTDWAGALRQVTG